MAASALAESLSQEKNMVAVPLENITQPDSKTWAAAGRTRQTLPTELPRCPLAAFKYLTYYGTFQS